MTIRIASTSVEPIEIVVTTDVDPSGATCKAKFLTSGSAAPASGGSGWVTGTWKTPVNGTGSWQTPVWVTVSGLTAGAYDVWVWIDGATYDPVLFAANLTIY